MVETIRETQLLVLACVLLTAGVAKLAMREAVGVAASGGSFSGLHGRRSAVVAVAAAEATLGVALLFTKHASVRLAATVVFVTAIWVVSELRRHRPELGCGCFGGLSSSPVGARALARAVLFAFIAVSTLGIPVTALDVVTQLPGWHGLIVVVEVAVLVALSPETGVAVARVSRRVPCELRTYPLEDTYATLRGSRAWREHADMVTEEEPADVWRELCWRFIVFAGRAAERPVEIVFAVYLEGRRPPVRVAVMEVTDQADREADDWDTGPREICATTTA